MDPFKEKREIFARLVHSSQLSLFVRRDGYGSWTPVGVPPEDNIELADHYIAVTANRGAEKLRIKFEDLVTISNIDGGEGFEQKTFLESLPPDCLAYVRPVMSALGPEGARLMRCALFSTPTLMHPELRERVSALGPEERAALNRGAAEALAKFDILGGWALAAGMVAEPETVLRIGDLLVSPEVTPTQWLFGLAALRLAGTRDAYMQIQRVGFESRQPGAIAAARNALLQVASDKGVQVWQVEDELVPTCSLEADDEALVDYGPRRFELRLDENLVPFLQGRDARTRHYDPPGAEPDDDPARVRHAEERWALVSEQLREAIPVQVHRLEESLIQQYRWDGPHWVTVVMNHPFLRHLVQRCVWGTYSSSGRKLLDTFRVARDRTLWGPDDEPYELDPESKTIGLVHPAELDTATRAAWGEILADYEVVTLFPQIDRPVYRYGPDHAKSTSLDLGIVLHDGDKLTHLHRRGWQDHRHSWRGELSKTFRSQNIRASVRVSHDDDEKATVEDVSFSRYLGYPQHDFMFRDVPPIVYSEVLYEFESLRTPHDTGPFAAIGSWQQS